MRGEKDGPQFSMVDPGEYGMQIPSPQNQIANIDCFLDPLTTGTGFYNPNFEILDKIAENSVTNGKMIPSHIYNTLGLPVCPEM